MLLPTTTGYILLIFCLFLNFLKISDNQFVPTIPPFHVLLPTITGLCQKNFPFIARIEQKKKIN